MSINFHLYEEEDEGFFIFSDELELAEQSLNDLLDQLAGQYLTPAAYLQEIEQLVSEYPTFVDGWVHIGIVYLEAGKTKKALQKYLHAIELSETAVPKDFNGKIEWVSFENRPYLRALYGAMLCYLSLRQKKKSIEAMERLLALSPNDNLGVRFMIGSEYFRSRQFKKKAKPFFEADAAHYPPYGYELALLHIQSSQWQEAASVLRRSFLANAYIAEVLMGNMRPEPLPIQHGSNYAEPEIAYEYVERYGKLWHDVPDAVSFLRWLWHQPQVLRERAAYLEIREALLWENDLVP